MAGQKRIPLKKTIGKKEQTPHLWETLWFLFDLARSVTFAGKAWLQVSKAGRFGPNELGRRTAWSFGALWHFMVVLTQEILCINIRNV